MRFLAIIILPVILLLQVAAADPASPDFDGTYNGAFTPSRGVSTSACANQPITGLKVEKGAIKSQPGVPSLDGFVNVKGFVTGRMRKADGSTIAFEGRAEDKGAEGVHLSAGVIDDGAGCAWTIDLKRQ